MTLTTAELTKIYQDLHQIPEIGLKEFETQAYLLKVIATFPQTWLTVKKVATATLVLVSGSAPHKTLGWRTDIDALPVQEQTGLPFVSKHAGMMHACGHDIHMSVALGLLSYFATEQPKNNMLFLFQPAEENASGGKRLYEMGALDDWMPDEIYGLHVNPQLPTGAIGCRQGTLFAGTCEIHAHFSGKSGHAAYPHLANDMVVAGAQFVNQIQTIVSRNVDPIQSGVVTLGQFHAGTIGNVISGSAQIDGTIRALTQVMNQHIQQRVRTIAEGIALSYDCQVDLDLHQGGYYPVENDPTTTAAFIKTMQADPAIEYVETEPAMTGEDFGFLISKIHGTMFWLGVDQPYQLHSEHLAPHVGAIDKGIYAMTTYFKQRDAAI
ncbi:N-acetyldiaminopimelate deacetylase [Loigolactobacillus jiayinensis]|uniref:N-acetyldiaminopimelate deacetylase n=1 Tax=Loigolactobacillus jiayinensis TaxID=2486016 RepID=A0ABW1RE98_9LACO|nr:N-acetyldiaminopimelate deacetylase [Loigolactobacillus jiayinensis]